MNNKKKEYCPELRDIMEMIQRYNATNKERAIIFSFVTWKDEEEDICEDCGSPCESIDKSKSMAGAYGDLQVLRDMLNDLRDLIEDKCGEKDFVNI